MLEFEHNYIVRYKQVPFCGIHLKVKLGVTWNV